MQSLCRTLSLTRSDRHVLGADLKHSVIEVGLATLRAANEAVAHHTPGAMSHPPGRHHACCHLTSWE
jgi:hypothetical protein